MTVKREDLEAEARVLGVVFTRRTGIPALRSKIDKARSALMDDETQPDAPPIETQPEEPGSPLELPTYDPREVVKCKVLWSNLHTSLGKSFAEDVISIPRAEAEVLEAADKVVIK